MRAFVGGVFIGTAIVWIGAYKDGGNVDLKDKVWGPDVASWQGTVDWQAVKNAGASFGITKSTEGVNYVNPRATLAWQGMDAAGLVSIQYHYARPAINSARAEADWFLQNALYLGEGDSVALDIEPTVGDPPITNGALWARTWVDIVSQKLGFQPFIYSNPSFIREQGFSEFTPLGKNNGLWLASWQESIPQAPPPWSTVALWQFSASGRVSGIQGDVDLNIFNGTVEQLSRYGMGGGQDTGGNPDGDPFANWSADRVRGMVSAIGYMGGDLADELDLPTIPRIKSIQAELRRVRKEQLG